MSLEQLPMSDIEAKRTKWRERKQRSRRIKRLAPGMPSNSNIISVHTEAITRQVATKLGGRNKIDATTHNLIAIYAVQLYTFERLKVLAVDGDAVDTSELVKISNAIQKSMRALGLIKGSAAKGGDDSSEDTGPSLEDHIGEDE
jgi:hypothetical protein